jgi:hypothetical protein
LGDKRRRHLLLLNQAVTYGDGCHFCAAGDVKLGQDVTDVGFNSGGTDNQFLGNFAVIQTGDQ